MEAGSRSYGRSDILSFSKGADVRASFHISLTDTIIHAEMIRSLAMAFCTYIRGTVHNISFRTGHVNQRVLPYGKYRETMNHERIKVIV